VLGEPSYPWSANFTPKMYSCSLISLMTELFTGGHAQGFIAGLQQGLLVHKDKTSTGKK
jgi:hypothetical protein